MSERKRSTSAGAEGGSSTRRSSAASNVNTSRENSQQTALDQSSTSEHSQRRTAASQGPAGGYGTMSSSMSRPTNTTPEGSATTSKASKKPPMGRRTTSTQVPHKGQEFSVDDAESEVDEDLQKEREKKFATHPSATLRRKPSTLRRRPTVPTPALATVDSIDDDEIIEETRPGSTSFERNAVSSGDETLQADEPDEEVDEDDGNISDAESFTLKDRQEAINETHPFGIRIWKPALYKKDRSVQRNAEGDIHSAPGLFVSHWVLLFNLAWTVLFGWWLALIAATGAVLCLLFGFSKGCLDYGFVLWGLAGYFFYPFGKYVKLLQDKAYAEEDEGEGRSISEYEQWQSGDLEEGRLFFGPININRSIIGHRRNSVESSVSESQSLLGRSGRGSVQHDPSGTTSKRRLFGRGKWNMGRVIFFIIFYGMITPCLFLVSAICWFLVFSIPMGKVTLLLFDHLRRHPLALSFHSDSAEIRRDGDSTSSILVCTYRAVGSKYWKYTIDGTNIFLINLLAVVAFVIFDYFVLNEALGIRNGFTSNGLLFVLALFSIIPLAYFIGQAVASISAQSSMGVGATINAFFSTVVEVFLYCVALKEGKAQLVEGSIVGSIFAGILFLPGLSMCFGALKRKTQRFNVRSAGVTSTMLLFSMIGCFGPTLFYQIYGSHELNCHQCVHQAGDKSGRDCRRCYFSQTPAVNDRFYAQAVRPFVNCAAVALFLSYVIGLMFTLRTHAAVIWNNEMDEKRAEPHDMHSSSLSTSRIHDQLGTALSRQTTRDDIRDSQLYKRILGQSLKTVGLSPNGEPLEESHLHSHGSTTPHVVPPRDGEHETTMLDEHGQAMAFHVAEIAATAAAVAARDATKAPAKSLRLSSTHQKGHERTHGSRTPAAMDDGEVAPGHTSGGGHDAPNWSRKKSTIVLLTATVAYAIIAEILVNTVDAVLENIDIDEKFLGITLFALVPNTTEFLNAISFAMNGNIALSMEIGSAYVLQVCLLQVPALVLFSGIYEQFIDPKQIINHTFTLIFPQWDMVTVILCIFLLSYMYGEGKSNYFKGSILILAYLVVTVGFYLSSYNDLEVKGVDPYDTLAVSGFMHTYGELQSSTFKTAGRRSGIAY